MKEKKYIIEESVPRKTQKNKLIHRALKEIDTLRTLAYEENQILWFHRMNELSIWVGGQLDYKNIEKEIDECDISEAIITM